MMQQKAGARAPVGWDRPLVVLGTRPVRIHLTSLRLRQHNDQTGQIET